MNSRRIERNAAIRPRRGAPPCSCRCPPRSVRLRRDRRAPLSRSRPAAHEMIFSPGATRSGLGRPSPGGPLGREVGDAVDVRHVAVRGADGDRASAFPGSLMVSERPAATEPRHRSTYRIRCCPPRRPRPRRTARADRLPAQRALAAGEPLRVELVSDAQVHAVDAQHLGSPLTSSRMYCMRPDHVAGASPASSSSTLRLTSLQYGGDAAQLRVGAERARLRRGDFGAVLLTRIGDEDVFVDAEAALG